MRLNRVAVVGVVAFHLGLIGGAASGDVLQPGQTLALEGTTPTLSPWLQGSVSGGISRPFEVRDASNAVVFSGTLVVDFVQALPFGVQYANYRLVGTSGVAGRAVTSVQIPGWRTSSVDAEFRSDLEPGTVPPSFAGRSLDGDTVTFLFTGGLPAGQDSRSSYIFSGATPLVQTGIARVILNTNELVEITGLPVPAPSIACPGDTNADGVVNFADLNSVLTNFGTACP
ncbi:MAG: hypothetical protein KF684_05715 [Phycisphaeraceae bacterium]|nr:hypothetical protein [Phycisphaeraceae bacterium]